MRLTIALPQHEHIRTLIRRAGYAEHRDRRSENISYTRRLGRTGFYPRFHLYIDERGDQVTLNLHLDQKQPTYAGSHAHSGEYEGELVEREMERISKTIQ